ncbi:hypothetical protein D3C78_745730 [compost metagenome]
MCSWGQGCEVVTAVASEPWGATRFVSIGGDENGERGPMTPLIHDSFSSGSCSPGLLLGAGQLDLHLHSFLLEPGGDIRVR